MEDRLCLWIASRLYGGSRNDRHGGAQAVEDGGGGRGVKEPRLILLEGNIGAGKSTLGAELKQSGLFDFVPEPVDQWRTGFAGNLLAMFYADPKRWAYTFQNVAFTTRAKTWQEILARTQHDNVVLERSILCDRYVFAQNCYETGLMSDVEWQVYVGMWDWVMANFHAVPHHILYLRTPVDLCMKRLRERARGEEVGVSAEYLGQLEGKHDDWLLKDPRAIVLDGRKWWTAGDIAGVLGVEHGYDSQGRACSLEVRPEMCEAAR